MKRPWVDEIDEKPIVEFLASDVIHSEAMEDFRVVRATTVVNGMTVTVDLNMTVNEFKRWREKR